ncbi:MAG: hypothetical protein HY586_04615 [Candidatus Omnitrophica bacterium]|nr:hypothetical protein [Candidatus Omnitrophota bacterium]
MISFHHFFSTALLTVLFLNFSADASSQPKVIKQFQSGPAQISLTEVYTSGAVELPKMHDSIPVIFRLDGPDDLGRKRLNTYAVVWKVDTVSAPVFVFNSKQGLKRGDSPLTGTLRVEVLSKHVCLVRFEPDEHYADVPEWHAMGAVLDRNFNVLSLEDQMMDRVEDAFMIPIQSDCHFSDCHFVVWITRDNDLEPVQAASTSHLAELDP